MISGMMNQLMTSGTSLDQGDFTSSRQAVTPPRPITQYSPISPLIAQSSPNLFKKMIGKNLFASIQKGFDEYEATKTQREEVKERVDRQIESGPVTVRARQAFVANSVAINEDIRMKQLAERGRHQWKHLPADLAPSTPPYNLLDSKNMSARSSRLAMRADMLQESLELSDYISDSYDNTATGSNFYKSQKYLSNPTSFARSKISGLEESSWDDLHKDPITALEDKLVKVLIRKQATIAKATRALEESGILEKAKSRSKKGRRRKVLSKRGKKTKKKSTKKKNVQKKEIIDFSDPNINLDITENSYMDEAAGGFAGISYRPKCIDKIKSKGSVKSRKQIVRIRPVKKSFKIPKKKSSRIKLVLSLLTEKPAKMSRSTRKRLYNKKETKKKKKLALQRREEIARPKLYRDAFAKI